MYQSSFKHTMVSMQIMCVKIFIKIMTKRRGYIFPQSRSFWDDRQPALHVCLAAQFPAMLKPEIIFPTLPLPTVSHTSLFSG